MNQNGTGIIYPTIELGGVTYELKFTRGALFYRLSRLGVDLGTAFTNITFSVRVDILHSIIAGTGPGKYAGTTEELADLVLTENKSKEVVELLLAALGKVFPPTQAAQAPATELAPLPN